MSETWFERASRIIRDIDAALPADADLKARRKALREGRPYDFRHTAWGQKAWSEAAGMYLRQHGAVPRPKPLNAGDLPLFTSPLDAARARARALKARKPRVG